VRKEQVCQLFLDQGGLCEKGEEGAGMSTQSERLVTINTKYRE